MKFYELPIALQNIMLAVSKQKAKDIRDGFLPISQHEYARIFWQLYDRNVRDEMGQQASAKEATELTHQLNQYLIANQGRFNSAIILKNPILIKRPKPPLRQQHCIYLPEIDSLDQKFIKNPDFGHPAANLKPGTVKNAPFYVGQILYSAARFSGLLRPDLINSLLHSLLHATPAKFKQMVWFELKGNVGEHYQWIPDPISCVLLQRYFKLRAENHWYTEPDFTQLRWLTCLRYFLRKSGSTQLQRLPSKRFFKVIIARLSLTHTPCHLPVHSGEEPNLTLAPDAFYRLLGRYSQVTSANVSEDKFSNDPISKGLDYPLSTKATTDCSLVLKTVKRELSSFKHKNGTDTNATGNSTTPQSLPELSKKLKALSQSSTQVLLPVTRLLIEWASVRLTSHNKWSGKLKPNTIIAYLGSIFVPLSRSLGAQNLLQFDADTIDERYMEIIDEAPTLRAQILRAKILRDFHLFLERDYRLQPSYVCSTMVMQGAKKLPLMVDANILLPNEYQQACEQLLKLSKLSIEPAKQYIQLLLLVLGFRCGLRRREAQFLRVKDLQTPGPNSYHVSYLTELLIRPHNARQLKSSASERRLPLGWLLTPTEHEWFNDYLKLCPNLAQTSYLFSDAKLSKPVDADLIFTPVVKLLKQITNDSGFRYHRLRHSFVSWTFWYWQQHKYPNDHPLKAFLQHNVMDHLPEARKQYFSQTANAAIRGELHAVSTMAGHSSPSMTLLHYLHSMQWCYSAECWRDYSLNLDTTAQLLNVPRRTFFDRLAKLGLPALLSNALTPWCHKLPDETKDVAAANTDIRLSEEFQYSSSDVREFYLALYLFDSLTKSDSCEPVTENTSDFGSDEYETDRSEKSPYNSIPSAGIWATDRDLDPGQFTNAIQLLRLRKSKKNRARRQYKDVTSGEIRLSNTARYTLPKWPKDGYAIKTVNLLISAFKQLSQIEQLQVLNIGKYVVIERFISWNNCQFRRPETLWHFVNNLIPILKLLPDEYFINIDILNRHELDSRQRAPVIALWQRPDNIDIPLRIKHSVYSDAKGQGYAALTLRTAPDSAPQRDQGDHGFYVAMTALYFYFEKASVSQDDTTSQLSESKRQSATPSHTEDHHSIENRPLPFQTPLESNEYVFADTDTYFPEDFAPLASSEDDPYSKNRRRKRKKWWEEIPDELDPDLTEDTE